MSKTATAIELSGWETQQLSRWSRSCRSPQRLVQRAHIISLAAEGIPSQEIARRLKISRPTVQLWRERFLALRLPGLEKDAPRPGRKAKIAPGKVKAIVQATLHSTPRGATHWSTRTMTRAQGFSEATVRRIWKRYRLQPYRVKTFKLSRDPRFIEKLHDIVGLYLNPPDKALVWCVDEKSQIQALERTEPLLPLRPACWPNRHTITSAMGRPLSSPPSACSMGKLSATPCRVIAILSGSLIFSKMPSCFKISRTLQRP
jgi:transposase